MFLVDQINVLNNEDWYNGVKVLLQTWNLQKEGNLTISNKEGQSILQLQCGYSHENVLLLQQLKSTQFFNNYFQHKVRSESGDYIYKFIYNTEDIDFNKEPTIYQIVNIFNNSYVMTTEHTLDENNCKLKYAIKGAIKLLNNTEKDKDDSYRKSLDAIKSVQNELDYYKRIIDIMLEDMASDTNYEEHDYAIQNLRKYYENKINEYKGNNKCILKGTL